ncbi:protein LSM14 homolog B-B isoform X2 [Malaya genurostris]|uniref:protein LSM14 homolog B-B isoform X2 n=1 Tax=Malaya genurostris TaxID=325434 RepID=UPI0026F37DA0|nr:protein LSM14 homolog B-B isoform X2 [Malaya genurostris]
MSCPMPEIGSCISLISKADIRYEGLLFTVDPDRCTIALARVKSYGTEDRETQFPIAPQNQCYDYILFRGSDIKDIRVINNNPVPNDPAIMQMHLPPQQPLPPMQNKLGQPGFQSQPGFMLPQMGPGPMAGPPPGHQPMGQPYSSFGGINNLGGMLSNDLVNKSPFPPGGPVNQMQQQQQQAQQQLQGPNPVGSSVVSGGGSAKAPGAELANLLNVESSLQQQPQPPLPGTIGSAPVGSSSSSATVGNEHKDQDLIGGGGGGGATGSRSTTPSNLLSRKSPTVDMGVQTNQQQQQQQQQQQGGGPQQNNNRDGNRSGGDGGNMDRGNNQRNRNNSQRNNNNNNQRERRDSGKNDVGQMKDNNYNKNMQRQGGQNHQNRGWNNNRSNNQNNSNNMRGRPRGRGGIPQKSSSDNYRRKSATPSDNNSNKKPPKNANPTNKKPNHNHKQGLNRAKNLLKFENDYDFEQANNKFEELRSQLSKLKVGDDVKPEQLNSETIDKKDDSGNETGAGDHEQEEDEVVCYDKAKSFFDTISCEAIERAKGKQQRTDWRQERKLNTETFGVGSTRRGGYNRRGGYYNRGPNNYRGNNQYRNNYRGRSGNRNNNQSNGLPHNNGGPRNHNNHHSQQEPQQPQQQRLQSPQPPQQQPAPIEVAAGK